jgi:hypothetical protein
LYVLDEGGARLGGVRALRSDAEIGSEVLVGARRVLHRVPQENGHRVVTLRIVRASPEDRFVFAESDRAIADRGLELAMKEAKRGVIGVASQIFCDVLGGHAVAPRLDAGAEESREHSARVRARFEGRREILLRAGRIAYRGEGASSLDELLGRRRAPELS